jgi:hypothetical protein
MLPSLLSFILVMMTCSKIPSKPALRISVESTVPPIVNSKELIGCNFLLDKRDDG